MSRVLASLVWLYPPAFRRRFGAEMTAVLRESLCALPPAPLTEHVGGTVRIVSDLLLSAAWEWGSRMAAAAAGGPEAPAWTRLRTASPQRTSGPEPPPFGPLPELRRRHAGRALPPRAPSMT